MRNVVDLEKAWTSDVDRTELSRLAYPGLRTNEKATASGFWARDNAYCGITVVRIKTYHAFCYRPQGQSGHPTAVAVERQRGFVVPWP